MYSQKSIEESKTSQGFVEPSSVDVITLSDSDDCAPAKPLRPHMQRVRLHQPQIIEPTMEIEYLEYSNYRSIEPEIQKESLFGYHFSIQPTKQNKAQKRDFRNVEGLLMKRDNKGFRVFYDTSNCVADLFSLVMSRLEEPELKLANLLSLSKHLLFFHSFLSSEKKPKVDIRLLMNFFVNENPKSFYLNFRYVMKIHEYDELVLALHVIAHLHQKGLPSENAKDLLQVFVVEGQLSDSQAEILIEKSYIILPHNNEAISGQIKTTPAVTPKISSRQFEQQTPSMKILKAEAMRLLFKTTKIQGVSAQSAKDVVSALIVMDSFCCGKSFDRLRHLSIIGIFEQEGHEVVHISNSRDPQKSLYVLRGETESILQKAGHAVNGLRTMTDVEERDRLHLIFQLGENSEGYAFRYLHPTQVISEDYGDLVFLGAIVKNHYRAVEAKTVVSTGFEERDLVPLPYELFL